MMKKVRLDQLVFDLGLAESRERAKTTIMSGLVFVDGQRADKPGMQVPPDANIEVRGAALPYVSRGGFKLEKALEVFPAVPADKVCIDCAHRPAVLPMFCCKTVRERYIRSMSDTDSLHGNSGRMSES